MNPELENLVDIALVDGYISDKERQVLKKKAEKLGFDVDELEMILDGRLHRQNNSIQPKVNKCPSCGEIINGFNKVCGACDYVVDTELINDEDTYTLEESFEVLQKTIKTFGREKKPGGTVFWGVVKIFLTYGLYIIYKLVRKRKIFDSYRKINEHYIAETNDIADSLYRRYGTNTQLRGMIDTLIAERDAIIRKRQNSDILRGVVGIVLMGIFIAICYNIANTPEAPETTEDKTERLIKENRIGEGIAASNSIEDVTAKKKFQATLYEMQIDSLTAAKNYDEALLMANMLGTDEYGRDLRQEKIDIIIDLEVKGLIENKEYKLARKRVELADILKRDNLTKKIDLAEQLDKKKK